MQLYRLSLSWLRGPPCPQVQAARPLTAHRIRHNLCLRQPTLASLPACLEVWPVGSQAFEAKGYAATEEAIKTLSGRQMRTQRHNLFRAAVKCIIF